MPRVNITITPGAYQIMPGLPRTEMDAQLKGWTETEPAKKPVKNKRALRSTAKKPTV